MTDTMFCTVLLGQIVLTLLCQAFCYGKLYIYLYISKLLIKHSLILKRVQATYFCKEQFAFYSIGVTTKWMVCGPFGQPSLSGTHLKGCLRDKTLFRKVCWLCVIKPTANIGVLESEYYSLAIMLKACFLDY